METHLKKQKNLISYNIKLFATILDLTLELRNKELKKLGFEQVELQTNNYSKLYADENGISQDLGFQDK